jgi:hypothetical protein
MRDTRYRVLDTRATHEDEIILEITDYGFVLRSKNNEIVIDASTVGYDADLQIHYDRLRLKEDYGSVNTKHYDVIL